jgi:hypothetical protein
VDLVLNTMKLEFLFVSTSDLGASLGLYRDGLGFNEVWREGDATVALALPGSDVQLMLDSHDPDAPIGPLFVVDSVEAFPAARPDRFAVVEAAGEIPAASWPPTRTRAGPALLGLLPGDSAGQRFRPDSRGHDESPAAQIGPLPGGLDLT